jgi:hypothetical protein
MRAKPLSLPSVEENWALALICKKLLIGTLRVNVCKRVPELVPNDGFRQKSSFLLEIPAATQPAAEFVHHVVVVKAMEKEELA